MYERALECTQEGINATKKLSVYLKERSELDQKYVRDIKMLQEKHRFLFRTADSSSGPSFHSPTRKNSKASFLNKMWKRGSKKDFRESRIIEDTQIVEKQEYNTYKSSNWHGIVAVFEKMQAEIASLEDHVEKNSTIADNLYESVVKYEKIISELKKEFHDINHEEKKANTKEEESHLRNWAAKLFKSLEEVERGRLTDSFEVMKSLGTLRNDFNEDNLSTSNDYSIKISSVYVEEDLQEYIEEFTPETTEIGDYTLQTTMFRRYAYEGEVWKETLMALKDEEKKIYLLKPGKGFKVSGIISLEGSQIHDADSSLMGRPYCFQIHVLKGTNTIKKNNLGVSLVYFSAKDQEEKDKWASAIANICQVPIEKSVGYPRFSPMNIQIKNIIRELNIEVMAAKQLPRDDYFCEIGFSTSDVTKYTPFAKTSIQFNTILPAWCEKFDFKNLDKDWNSLILIICSKKSNKIKRQGYLEIPLKACESKREWFKLSPSSIDFGEVEIQIEYEFKEDFILPLQDYDQLYKLVSSESVQFLNLLHDFFSTPEEMETLSTHIFDILNNGGGDPLVSGTLIRLISYEITTTTSFQTLFRGNSLVMRISEKFLSSCGRYYLQEALGTVLKEVIQNRPYLEVNPRNAIENLVQVNRISLLRYVNKFLDSIFQAVKFLPNEIRAVFHIASKAIFEKWGKDNQVTSISAIFFLRFVVPNIMSPTKNKLVDSQPDTETTRSLLMIAKVIQRFANFSKEMKEEYLQPIVDQLASRRSQLEDFINELSNASGQHRKVPAFNPLVAKYLSYFAKDLILKGKLIQEKIDSIDQEKKENQEMLEYMKRLKKSILEIEFKSSSDGFFQSFRTRASSFSTSNNMSFEKARPRIQSELYPTFNVATDGLAKPVSVTEVVTSKFKARLPPPISQTKALESVNDNLSKFE